MGGFSPRGKRAPQAPASPAPMNILDSRPRERRSPPAVPASAAPPPPMNILDSRPREKDIASTEYSRNPPAALLMARRRPPSSSDDEFSGLRSSSSAAVTTGDPVTAVASLQSFDGSFALDSALLALLQRKKGSLSLPTLRTAIPEQIRGGKNAETVWATVLAATYMMVALADRRSIWESLWDKAQEFVCQETSIAPYQFTRMVQAASAELLNIISILLADS